MANRSSQRAMRWLQDTLHRHGWPLVPYRFLAQLQTYIGDEAVEHYDCSVIHADDDDIADGSPDSTATLVVFTATHVIVQTVDCLRRPKRFASDVQVLRRSNLLSITSVDEQEVDLPCLRRLSDWLTGWSQWLADLVADAVDRHPWLARWYDVDEPDGEVVVDLTYRDLREQVLTLPMEDDASSSQRLTQFLPSLAADLP